MINADLKNISILPVEQNKRHLFLSDECKQKELLIFLYANACIEKNKTPLLCAYLTDHETHSHICYGNLNQATAIFLLLFNMLWAVFSVRSSYNSWLRPRNSTYSNLTFTEPYPHCRWRIKKWIKYNPYIFWAQNWSEDYFKHMHNYKLAYYGNRSVIKLLWDCRRESKLF